MNRDRAEEVPASPIDASAPASFLCALRAHDILSVPERCADLRILRQAGTRTVGPLTRRQGEILMLVCDGASNRQIAAHLGLRVSTVKYHLVQMCARLGVYRRTQLVALAIHLQLVRPAWLPR